MVKVESLQFPPTETNVTEYFKTMKEVKLPDGTIRPGKPIPEIKDAFQNYGNAFYVHSGKIDHGDVVYSEPSTRKGRPSTNLRLRCHGKKLRTTGKFTPMAGGSLIAKAMRTWDRRVSRLPASM